MSKPLVGLFPVFALLVLIGCGGRSHRASSEGCVGVASTFHARDVDAPDPDGSTTGSDPADEDTTGDVSTTSVDDGETTGTGAGTTGGDVDESTTGSIETAAAPGAGCP